MYGTGVLEVRTEYFREVNSLLRDRKLDTGPRDGFSVDPSEDHPRHVLLPAKIVHFFSACHDRTLELIIHETFVHTSCTY